MQLKIQELLRNNDFDAATAILDEKDIRWKFETSSDTGKEYLHLDYGIKCSKDDVITKECRGIALEKHTWNIVRFGFYRFMNLGEGGCDIAIDDQDEFEYDEKADGSIIILSHFDGRWVAGSRGVLFPKDALDNGLTLEQLFWVVSGFPASSGMWNSVLDEDVCYIFELCTMANRIVIPYERAQIVLLGARRKSNDWRELNTEEIYEMNTEFFRPIQYLSEEESRFRRPYIHFFDTIKECAERAENLHGFEEGFVVKRWNEAAGRYDRAKVKGRAYLDLHHVVSGLSIRNLARMAVFGDREPLESFPEYLDSYDVVRRAVVEHCDDVEAIFTSARDEVQEIEDEKERKKAFAMALRKFPKFQQIQGICFALYTGKIDSVWEMVKNKTDRSGIKHLVENLGLKQLAGEKWVDSGDADEDV